LRNCSDSSPPGMCENLFVMCSNSLSLRLSGGLP
jgi:hypothetical protein